MNKKVRVLHPSRPVDQSPQEVVRLLQAGNARYVSRERSVRSLQSSLTRQQLAEQGQNPMAMVLTCADSRITSEGIFDCGFGDLFVVRNFGNAVDEATVGSFEYGAKVLEIPLLLILGHTGCSAIRSALEVHQGRAASNLPSHSSYLARRLEPVIEKLDPHLNNRSKDPAGEDLFQRLLFENLQFAADEIQRLSPMLSEALRTGTLGLVMGLYDLAKGTVVLSELQNSAALERHQFNKNEGTARKRAVV